MPWIYEQSTGRIRLNDGPVLAIGYSGAVPYVNSTSAERLIRQGPIPRGKWMIREEFDSESHGPVSLRLLPAAGTDTFGRDGFLIHGDSREAPGRASMGCICLPRVIRLKISASDDHELLVV